MSAFHENKIYGLVGPRRWVWLAVVIAVAGSESAFGQYGGMPNMPGGMLPYNYQRSNRTNNTNNPNSNSSSTQNRGPQQFQGTATIVRLGDRGLEVTDASGNNWRLAPEKNCVVQVTGTADPSFLKPDMLVQFTAQFDKKGNATAPVNELEIVSPQAAMNSIKQEIAGKKEVGASTNGAIVGHIKTIKNNQFTVVAPNGSAYSAELGPNPSIKVNVSDFRWAQPGDKVDAVGYYSQPGMASAQQMRITLSNPLGEVTKKKPAAKTATNK